MLRSKSTPMIAAPISSIPKSSSFADVHEFRRKALHRATHDSTGSSTPNYSPLPSPSPWSERQDPFNMGGFCTLPAQDDHSWKWIDEEVEEELLGPTFQPSPFLDVEIQEKDMELRVEDVIAEEDKLGILTLQLDKIWNSALPEGLQSTAASLYPEDEPHDLDAVHAMHYKRRITRPPTPETSFTSTSILFQPEMEDEKASQSDSWLGLIRRFVVQGHDASGLLVKSDGH